MGYSEEKIQKVWEKGSVVSGVDAAKWRKDECGAWIGRTYYGDRRSPYGWDVDHITPQASGGSDDLPNLRPLQSENNRARQAGPLECVVTSSGSENVRVPAPSGGA